MGAVRALAVIALILAIAAPAALSLVQPGTQIIGSARYQGTGIRVDYTRPAPGEEPRFIVSLASISPGDRVSISAYAWLSNGSFRCLGRYSSSNNVVVLDWGALAKAMGDWVSHYRELGLSPEGVSLGILLIGTVARNDGLYAVAASVPVSPSLVAEGSGVTVRLSSPPIKILDIDEVRESLAKSIGVSPDKLKMNEKASSSDEWPPNIRESCYNFCYGPHTCYMVCYEWHPESGSPNHIGLNVRIPLVASVIKGEEAYNGIYYVVLREVLRARSQASVSIGISAVAGITGGGGGGGVSYSIIGYSWVASDEKWADLDYSKGFMPGQDFTAPNTVLYVGFKGDIAVSKYRLYRCVYWFTPPQRECAPLNEWANITVVRPAGGAPLNNSLGVWGTASLYNYNDPVTRQYIDLVLNDWLDYSNQRLATNNITLTSYMIRNELNTLLSLSGGVNVLSLIMPSLPAALAPILGVSVGVTVNTADSQYMDLWAHIRLNTGEELHWEYAKSPILYFKNGNQYRIGMVYIRVTG